MDRTTIKYDTAYLAIEQSQDEFKSIILKEIEFSENHFNFNDLVYKVRNKCSFKKERNVEYRGGMDFMGFELDFINTIVWEQIWEKKLMIDFTNERVNRNSNISFLKTKNFSDFKN